MVLSCHKISKAYGTDEIIKDVSFQIEQGEKAAIIGNNGACLLYTSDAADEL